MDNDNSSISSATYNKTSHSHINLSTLSAYKWAPKSELSGYENFEIDGILLSNNSLIPSISNKKEKSLRL